jgi:hypothetical protein
MVRDGHQPSGRIFSFEALSLQSRQASLPPERVRALAEAVELSGKMSRNNADAGKASGEEAGDDVIREFLLPLAAAGLDARQMLELLSRVPAGWSLSHREMYYDFRLARWQKHIEPPTLAGLLEEYLASASSEEEGLAYLLMEWERFLKRHGGG